MNYGKVCSHVLNKPLMTGPVFLNLKANLLVSYNHVLDVTAIGTLTYVGKKNVGSKSYLSSKE